jgi:hypothetical protein
LTLADEPQAGDLVVYRERGAPSGPCRLGAFGAPASTAAPTCADALRRGNQLALTQQVNLWTSYRARWADATAPTFTRVSTHRPAGMKKGGLEARPCVSQKEGPASAGPRFFRTSMR